MSKVIGLPTNTIKPGDFRDAIERLEAEQADYLARMEDGNVISGPELWFKDSAWGTPKWGAPGYRFRRTLEDKAYREQRYEARGIPSGIFGQDTSEAAAADFLRCLDPSAESFTFQTYDDDKERRRSRNDHPLDRIFNGSLTAHKGELTRLNDEGAGVSVTINETNGKGRRAHNMIRAIWQEDDNGFPPNSFPLRPSIVVETSPGHFHRYWLVEGLTNEEHKCVMERMVESFGSDKSAKEFNKAMRLPGFWNRKPGREPFHVRVIAANGARYSRDQILRAFPPLPPPPKEKPRNLAGRRQETSEETKARALDALNCISPDCCREDWIAIGMSLKHEFGETGWEMWDHWSSGSKEKYKPNDTRDKWNSFRGGNGNPRTIATLFDLAQKNGYRQHAATAYKPKSAQVIKLNSGNQSQARGGTSGLALSGSGAAPEWDLSEPDSKGRRKRLCNEHNARLALQLEGVTLSFNEFSHEKLIWGLERCGPRLDDAAADALYMRLWTGYGLKYSDRDLHALLSLFCHEGRSHPVRGYIDGLEWDGKPRLGAWLHIYLGAPKTELNSFIGKATLIAAVRRVRHPGCKFDYLTILEGPQGIMKSSGIQALCPEVLWFLDGFKLSTATKEVMELTSGKWLVEISELVGRKMDHNAVKTLLSKQRDKARMAYGHYSDERERQFIFIGTTNDEEYLLDPGRSSAVPSTSKR